MRISRRLLAASALCLLPAFAWANDSCAVQAPQKLDLDLAGIHTVRFDIGSDDVNVNGGKGANMAVRGRACASSQKALDSLHLTHHREGDTLVLRTQHDQHQWSLFHNAYAYYKLSVSLPASMHVTLDAGSGDLGVHGVASVDGQVGSGDVKVSAVAGAVKMSTGSGDLQMDDIGSLNITSVGSGDVRVRGVSGDANVGSIGSGDMHLVRVDGSVQVRGMGSGDLTVRGVKHDVHVGHMGSGDVEVDDIGGNFRLDSQGSGDVTHHDVRGQISVPHRDDD
ncbi:DUF4097 family beta strand repeat-containing protein [Oleiagrimonas sp. C23AA]|uniref:DUF4097 family beta strand repeat-containing protein n=1 Tax=Oleiagrimonas sp. C23AA TaxID=2719047 RepID=UPI00141FE6D0|nr:DUF4097 family beta strand repeat-containing protein [Oleiagrimonas sp. C23AA]NII11416.1 DUF4097 domain-containing protein [Oleiagrimonas sp. C23AA]